MTPYVKPSKDRQKRIMRSIKVLKRTGLWDGLVSSHIREDGTIYVRTIINLNKKFRT